MDSGAQYVVTGGIIEIPLLCADSWDMKDVSGMAFNCCLMLIISISIICYSEGE